MFWRKYKSELVHTSGDKFKLCKLVFFRAAKFVSIANLGPFFEKNKLILEFFERVYSLEAY